MQIQHLAVLLAWEGGYIRWRTCSRHIGLNPDGGGLRALLALRKQLLASVLGREPLPPSGDATARDNPTCGGTMLTNADIVSSIDGLSDALRRAREALTHSDDLPPLDLAETMVLTVKLGEKLSKLADRVQSLAAPLFAEGAANGEETNGEETNGEETNNGEERRRGRSR